MPRNAGSVVVVKQVGDRRSALDSVTIPGREGARPHLGPQDVEGGGPRPRDRRRGQRSTRRRGQSAAG